MIFSICLCIMAFGVPVIYIKRYYFYKKVQIIPKSNIIISKSQSIPKQCVETESIQNESHLSMTETSIVNQPKSEETSTSTMNIFEFLEKTQPNVIKVTSNTNKNNKNLINLTGIAILSAIFTVLAYLILKSRYDWRNTETFEIFGFSIQCCSPIILPTIYFVRKPKHLISVLQDFNFIWPFLLHFKKDK